MNNLREGLRSLLVAGLPETVRVIGYPVYLDAVAGRTVALWAAELNHLEAAPNGHYSVDYTVQLFTAHQDPARADDDLDEFLSDVLAVLWDSKAYLLDRAERTVTNETTHSWTLTVRAALQITEETP